MIELLIDVADQLGVIQAVKGKLLRQPDPAAEKLVIALDEIYKIYGSMNDEISTYLGLWFDPSNPPIEQRKTLISFEGGEIKARMGKARGHCHKIFNIYLRYLKPWFSTVLSTNEAHIMEKIFHSFRELDISMLDNIDHLAYWLSKEATVTLDLLDAGNLDEANRRVQAARKEIQPDRLALAKAMRDLLDLQAEFIEVSGTV